MNLMRQIRGRLLKGVRTVAIVCNQWGDSGKGKLVDLLAAYWAHYVVRGTGGANAGHTIVVGNLKFIFHLLPSAILHRRVKNVIGSGVAFDPKIVKEEIEILKKAGRFYVNLFISMKAHLVLPWHLLEDRLREAKAGSKKIGTTGRGIGPLYGDIPARYGLVVNDLLNPLILRRKMKESLKRKIAMLKTFDRRLVKKIMHDAHLGSGRYWHPKKLINIDAVLKDYVAYGRFFRTMVCDTEAMVRKAHSDKKHILLEGAQGVQLSVNHGTHPNVTASDCSHRGLALAAGLHESEIDLVLGLAKFPISTRVGGGPLVAELGGKKSERWCLRKGVNEDLERKKFPNANVNSADEFIQGVALRRIGGEFGATTGRPRRPCRFDLVMLRSSLLVSGQNVVLTKLDMADDLDEIKICESYRYVGETGYRLGERFLWHGDYFYVAPQDDYVLRNCQPIYHTMPGWNCDTSKVRTYKGLPKEARDVIKFCERQTGMVTRMVSVGADRLATIIK